MMRKCMLSVLMLLVSVALFAQEDPIVGKWQNPSGEGRIEIYKKDNKYFGRLYWLKNPNETNGRPKKDINNPNKSLQDRSLQGLEILTDFSKNGSTYEGGKIYDPKSGKTYSCKMTIKGSDKLDIRGYMGVSLLGRTETWSRVK